MRRLISIGVACVALVALAASPASGAPKQGSLTQVISALKVESLPSDYVIVVDTSASMTKDGRYGRVQSALRSMLQALQPSDHVSLVTFDTTAQVRFRGSVGANPLEMMSSLPETPTGARTDIGAGIEAGIAELERSSENQLAAIALITDGLLDASDGSEYVTADSPGWVALKKRAKALTDERDVAAYALALGSSTDAALLKGPFPRAVSIPAGQFSERLGDLQRELLSFQAAEKVRPELKQEVVASWSELAVDRADPGSLHDVTITLTSEFSTIPVEIEQLAVEGAGDLALSVTGLPDSVALAPGATVEVPATVQVGDRADATGTLALAGRVTSPWQKVLTEDFALGFKPALANKAPLTVSSADSEPMVVMPRMSPQALAGAAGLLFLVLAFFLMRLRQPRLTGSLTVTRHGAVAREVLLEGRSVKFTVPGDPGLVGTVSADRGSSTSVKVMGKVNASRQSAQLRDGDSMELGDFRIRYTAQHTRIMSMIKPGLDESEARLGPEGPDSGL